MADGSEAKPKKKPAPAPVAKKEEAFSDSDSEDIPISSIPKAKPKKEGFKEDDDEDDVPIALSRIGKKQQLQQKKQPGIVSKAVKKERSDEKMVKQEVLKSNGKSYQVTKKDTELWEDDEEEGDYKSKEKINKKKLIVKKDEEKKAVVKKSHGASTTNGKEKKEKKVYDLPGQKHDPPEERDPLRIFYETLYNQIPKSEMAAIWMMEWGLLRREEAKKIYDKKLKKAQQQKLGSPMKAASANKTSAIQVKNGTTAVLKAVAKPLKKRKVGDSDDEDKDDDDFMTPKKGAKKQKISH